MLDYRMPDAPGHFHLDSRGCEYGFTSGPKEISNVFSALSLDARIESSMRFTRQEHGK
jgi:hypothetical protein